MTLPPVPRPEILDRLPYGRSAVIEASAGTGKTFTLEHLIVELITRRGATLEEILVVTFTEKATREMRHRVRHKLAQVAANPDGWNVEGPARRRLDDAVTHFDRAAISTIHGFCQRVLSERAFESHSLFEQSQVDGRASFGGAFREELRVALRQGDPLEEAVRTVTADLNMNDFEDLLYKWFTERGQVAPDDPADAGEAFGDVDLAFYRLVRELLPRVHARVDADRRARGELDFDDMIARVGSTLAGPTGEPLLRALRETYRYALVDEFQDTDDLQWDVFRRLFFESQTNALYVIGDPKQAIYSFRGADVHTYLRARDEILAAGGEVVHLDRNFRSTASMLEGQSRIFGSGFFEGGIDFVPVRAGRPELRAVDAEGAEVRPLKLLQVLGEKGMGFAAIKATLHDFVAREILRIANGGLRFGSRGKEAPIRFSDIHVLTRSGKEAKEVGAALRRYGVPHAFFKQMGLFDRPEARDILHVLRAVANPGDRSARLKAWMTPFFAVPLEDLSDTGDLPAGHPLLARLHEWHALSLRHAYLRLLRALTSESGLLRRELFLRESERRLTNYLHILELLLEGTHQGARDLPGILALLEAYMEGRAVPSGESGSMQRLESDLDAVQVLTMHTAKGLEATVVFIAGGLTDGPSRSREPKIYREHGRRYAWCGPRSKEMRARTKEERDAEDARLLYVALTRAKGRLYLPFVNPPPKGHAQDGLHHGRRPGGAYAAVNRRLDVLAAEGVLDEAASPFEYEGLVHDPRHLERPPTFAESLASWQPPEAWLEPLPDPRPTLHARKKRHAGFVITSYTRIKSDRQALASLEEGPGEEFLVEGADVPRVDAPDEPLPGGAAVGIFLHEVLEELDFGAVRAGRDAETWLATGDVRALFEARARSNNLSLALVPHAARMLFCALRTPVSLGPHALTGGLAEVTQRVAEMVFHFPIPEGTHPPLSARPPSNEAVPFRAERGFVRGVVDLVFEHEGRIYFLDWKSDRLPSFTGDAVRAHIDEHYALQARLYTLGIVRMLHVHDREAYDARFGGLLYGFLRGMARGEAAAAHFDRPDWDAANAWERALKESDAPWGYPLLGAPP